MRRKKEKRAKGRQSRKSKPDKKPRGGPDPGAEGGSPDVSDQGQGGARAGGPARPRAYWFDRLIGFIIEVVKGALAQWLVILIGGLFATVFVMVGPRLKKAWTRSQCSTWVAPIREAMVSGDWHSVSAQIRKWESDCRGWSLEFDVEVDLYRASNELWEGRISSAREILDAISHSQDVSLRARADYVDTVLDRAAGRFHVARESLQGLVSQVRIEPLPDDVRFDALYDLTILEMHLGDFSKAEWCLSQIKEAAGYGDMLRRRKVLLEGLVSYMRGQWKECIQVLEGLDFDQRAPTREGLRLSYLALCREQLGESEPARVDRRRAEEYLDKAGNKWERLELTAHEISWTLDALDRQINRSLDSKDKASAAAAVSKDIEKARTQLVRFAASVKDQVSITKDDVIPWIHLRLKLLEAQLALLRLKFQKPVDAEPLQNVRRDINGLLDLRETKELVLFQVWCHLALAQLAVIEENQHETAASSFKQAVDLAEHAGLLNEATRAKLKRAEYRRRAGDRDGCRQDVLDAIEIWKKLGNDTWAQSLEEYLTGGGCWHAP